MLKYYEFPPPMKTESLIELFVAANSRRTVLSYKC